MKRFVLSGHAKADLLSIWKYLAENSGIEAADQIIDSIIDRFHF